VEKIEGVIRRSSLSMLENNKEKLRKLPTLIDTDSLLPTNALNVNFILLKMSKTVKY
jgi:hypothetical protein